MREGSEKAIYGQPGAPVGHGDARTEHERAAERLGGASRLGASAGRYGVVSWVIVLLLAGGAALRMWPIMGAATDYDEGVYWQSLRALSHGSSLFTSVFSSQPPVFLYSLYPFYLALGQSLTAARIGVVVYSLVGLVAAYVIGRSAAGHRAGQLAAVLLALDPLYVQESRTLQAEVPALCWALVGVALAMAAWRAHGARRLWLSLGAGVAIALGIGVKLFDVVALVPAVLYLLAPVGAAFLDAEGGIARPDAQRLRAEVRAALPTVGALLLGLCAGLVVVVAPFVGSWSALLDQVVSLHVRAGTVFATGLIANASLLANVGSEVPLELAALAAAGIAVWWRVWRAVPLILWAAAAGAVLLDQHPLFTHHVALMAPSLASLVAVVVVVVWEPAQHSRAAAAAMSGAARWLPAGALAVVAALAAWGLVAGAVQSAQVTAPSARQVAIADVLAATTRPGDFVLSDDQYLAALANRDVPPQLVDTSQVRIRSGYLTAAQLERAAQDANVRDVLFASGRFDEVPGFRAWVAAHFTKVADFGNGVVVYARVPQSPASA